MQFPDNNLKEIKETALAEILIAKKRKPERGRERERERETIRHSVNGKLV